MEQAQLRLHEQSLGLLHRAPGPPGPLDHFFPPLLPGLPGLQGLQSTMPSIHGGLPGMGGSVPSLPGFLTHHHAAYPSYLTPPTSSAMGVAPPHPQAMAAATAPPTFTTPPLPISPPLPLHPATHDRSSSPGSPEQDLRSSSIVALRLRAKEHLESLVKTSALRACAHVNRGEESGHFKYTKAASPRLARETPVIGNLSRPSKEAPDRRTIRYRRYRRTPRRRQSVAWVAVAPPPDAAPAAPPCFIRRQCPCHHGPADPDVTTTLANQEFQSVHEGFAKQKWVAAPPLCRRSLAAVSHARILFNMQHKALRRPF
ncbi:hypothetical protein GWK47_033480 [Chionoecetes opilio]|uniref:OAR domain-containing protein n=1 Tax=Chionoecetes opilio TaxID=41210 RepID=A0A8J4YS03_CHIOP|nr:hypothetical protein GWK47_033480 [Chionoecetes opilio]